MKAYLAGPMSGHPDLNFPAFHAWAKYLRAQGLEVVNPAEINGGDYELIAYAAMDAAQRLAQWRKCMRRDIIELMTCDAIYLMEGWKTSTGAMLESFIARSLDMPVTLLEGKMPPEVVA